MRLRIAECDFDEADDSLILDAVRVTIEETTLEAAAVALRVYQPDVIVGRGGHHIWVAQKITEGDGTTHAADIRLLMIVECT